MLTLLGCLVIFKVNIEGLKKLFSLTKLDAIKGLIIWHRWKFLFFFMYAYMAPLGIFWLFGTAGIGMHFNYG